MVGQWVWRLVSMYLVILIVFSAQVQSTPVKTGDRFVGPLFGPEPTPMTRILVESASGKAMKAKVVQAEKEKKS